MIIHVDMDAFYASVEERDRPELANRPVIVGGSPQGRGVVSAANYVARRYGVHSAMPTVTAARLCPEGVFLPVRMERYIGVSQQIHDIFQRYTPVIEPLSLDEAFLDVRGSEGLFGDAVSIAHQIQRAILDELQLHASVGVAPNKFLAKIASDLEKPRGFVVVEEAQVQSFLDPLPVSRLWGVGKAAQQRLHGLGIYTVGDVRESEAELLQRALGRHGMQLWELAHGRDARPVVAEREAKSVSHETTFSEDIIDASVLRASLLQLTEQVAWRLRRHSLQGRTVQLKIRFQDFTTLTRSQSLASSTDRTDTLWRAVRELFDTRLQHPLPPVRLIGMGVHGFDNESMPAQNDLFMEPDAGSELDQLNDSLRERFGDAVLQRARGLRRPGQEKG
ncbi:MAG: DNA polymerase IV [Gammaproteobacteria bacterium]|nr:DNA polymerase IV [Gammaproteobacteria bacterium]